MTVTPTKPAETRAATKGGKQLPIAAAGQRKADAGHLAVPAAGGRPGPVLQVHPHVRGGPAEPVQGPAVPRRRFCWLRQLRQRPHRCPVYGRPGPHRGPGPRPDPRRPGGGLRPGPPAGGPGTVPVGPAHRDLPAGGHRARRGRRNLADPLLPHRRRTPEHHPWLGGPGTAAVPERNGHRTLVHRRRRHLERRPLQHGDHPGRPDRNRQDALRIGGRGRCHHLAAAALHHPAGAAALDRDCADPGRHPQPPQLHRGVRADRRRPGRIDGSLDDPDVLTGFPAQ